MNKKLQRGCVVYMAASSGLKGYGNEQCVSWVSHELGELSLFGHNQHYKTYDVRKVVSYPESTPPVSAMEDGWVDVRNALPDNEGLYLAWVTNHSFLGPPESFFIVYYGFANDEDATEMFWSYMMKPIDVTHWRPLPPPPSNR